MLARALKVPLPTGCAHWPITRLAALQIHQLNSSWSESRKASYVRHAVREYTIHKALRHTNIVSLTDIFEVSNKLLCQQLLLLFQIRLWFPASQCMHCQTVDLDWARAAHC